MKIAGNRFEGMRTLSGLAAVTMTVLLAGCTLPPPRELPPPRAAPLAPLATPWPLVALALGGGGARGFAHIGVIKVLEGSGIVPDIVVGSSSGAIVAALYAGGMSGVELERTAVMLERDDLIDVVFEGRFMVRGALLQEFVNRTLGYRAIEELARPFALVATERGSGAMTVFNRGDTGLAVRASAAVPDLFLPVAIAGRQYVDGGLSSPVPAKLARAMGADVVIAVDVSRAWYSAARRLLLEGELKFADVVVRPETPRTRLLDFDRTRENIAAGEAATQALLARIHEAIAGATAAKGGQALSAAQGVNVGRRQP